MDVLPVYKRKKHAFLSHSHRDKAAVVDKLYEWLSDTAGVDVWYDSTALPGGANFTKVLEQAIPQCRSLLLVLSQAALQSGWVEEEYLFAINHSKQFRDFNIIPVIIDDSQPTGFIALRNWIQMPNGELSLKFCDQLLTALYFNSTDGGVEVGKTNDLYISRTWRENEEDAPADYVCRHLIKSGFRLVGDSKDQVSFKDDVHRVEAIISSCSGLVAILPYREEEKYRASGNTSSYMLKEINFARQYGLKYVVAADPRVVVPPELTASADYFEQIAPADMTSNTQWLQRVTQALKEDLKPPPRPQYVFFGTDFKNKQRNKIVRQLIERITGMPCVMGEELRGDSAPQIIAEYIANAYIMIADVSSTNINTCIEAGIAMGTIAHGANLSLYLVADASDRERPFMFRAKQYWYYDDDAGLLGTIHKILYEHHRRRVLNYEFPD